MSRKNKMTIRDVACKSNVSIATVSRVINNSGPVSTAAKEKVLQVIRENNYYPNLIARNLKTDKTKTIAMLVSDGMNGYFAQIINGIESVVRADDYMLFVCNSQNNEQMEKDNLRLIEQKKVDGLIIQSSGYNDKRIAELSDRIPTVLIHRLVRDESFHGDFLDADHGALCSDLTLLLIRNGHRKIAFISGPMHLSSMEDRYKNFVKSMSSIHVQVTPEYRYYFEGPLTQEFGRQAIHAILSADDPPTAVIIAHGETTLGVIRYCREHQIQIPQTISFATPANITLADLLYIRPTYAMPDVFTLGERAATLLMSRINSGNSLPNREVVYMPSIIPGDSIRTIASD
jgi:LacI family transcriptional regulator